MSTHILSDIEALCDEVAILRNGKLAATGNLEELLTTSGEKRGFEIGLSGISEEVIRPLLRDVADVEVLDEANGVMVVVQNENSIDAVLAAARTAGGKLISVQRVKQSLEELFVKQND
jgi:ABC-2 type transport system ATP-binding protein